MDRPFGAGTKMTSLDNMIDELEQSVNEETGKHVVRQLFDKVNKKEIMLRSDLNDNEIKLIAKLKTIADQPVHLMRIPVLHEICDKFMCLRASLTRQGRQELIDAMKQIADNRTGARAMSVFGNVPPRSLV